MPPQDMLVFIASQLQINPSALLDYGQREATRWEHLNELYAYLGLRPFRHDDELTIKRIAREEAAGTDRGDAIVETMITFLRQTRVVLPAATELERIALTARAQVRKRFIRWLAFCFNVDQQRKATRIQVDPPIRATSRRETDPKAQAVAEASLIAPSPQRRP
jgi:hypothetical protein